MATKPATASAGMAGEAMARSIAALSRPLDLRVGQDGAETGMRGGDALGVAGGLAGLLTLGAGVRDGLVVSFLP